MNGRPDQPKWMEFIRVRECRILGSDKPPEFVLAFGPANICTPCDTPEKAERLAQRVREWLLVMMDREEVTR